MRACGWEALPARAAGAVRAGPECCSTQIDSVTKQVTKKVTKKVTKQVSTSRQ